MSFINFFSGFARPAIAASFVAALAMVSGCVIAPMRVQFDPCVGQVAGGATLGGLAGGILGGRAGAITGAVGGSLATAIQGCHPQGQAGQPMVARPQVVKVKDCNAIGGQLENLNGQVVCHIRSTRFPDTTKTNGGSFCLYQTGWGNDQFAGLRHGAQSASDQLVGRVARDFPAGPGQVVKPC